MPNDEINTNDEQKKKQLLEKRLERGIKREI